MNRFLAARREAAKEPGVPTMIELLAAESAIREIPDDEILMRVQKLGKLSDGDARAIDPVLMDVEMHRIVRMIVPGGQVTSMDPAKRYFRFKGAGLKKGSPDWENASGECLAFWRAGRRPADTQSLKMFLALACEAAFADAERYDGKKPVAEIKQILEEMTPLARLDAGMRPAIEKWGGRANAFAAEQAR